MFGVDLLFSAVFVIVDHVSYDSKRKKWKEIRENGIRVEGKIVDYIHLDGVGESSYDENYVFVVYTDLNRRRKRV